MNKYISHYYEADVKTVYNAYIKAIKDKFNIDCIATPYYTVGFGLKYSFKYNMNGGECNVYFIPYQTGTAVGIHYKILQLLGARYKAHDMEMTKSVENELNILVKDIEINFEEFMNEANRISD